MIMLFVAQAMETHEGLVTGDTLQAPQVGPTKKCEIDVFFIGWRGIPGNPGYRIIVSPT